MIVKKCIECGKEYKCPNYRKLTSKWCSRKCYADSNRGIERKESVTGNNGYRKTKTNTKGRLAHRRIMENHLGRKLDRFELVHHINGDKADNRLENLVVMTPKEHAVHHNQKYPVTKKCLVCGKEFKPHPTKRARAKTCSKECKKTYNSMKLRKPDAPNSMYREGAYPCQVERRIQYPNV